MSKRAAKRDESPASPREPVAPFLTVRCQVCDRPFGPGLGGAGLIQALPALCHDCYAAGVLWAAKQARARTPL